MNATGCVTALGDGGDAFVVLMPAEDDHCGHRRRPPEPTCLPPVCPGQLANSSRRSPSPSPSPPPLPPQPAAEAYKTRPRRKDRNAFVVLPEPPPPPPATTTVTQPSDGSQPAAAVTAGCSGRVSPFRGNGFKTPENGRSRAASPSAEPLKRQASEPRIPADRRRPTGKQRLSSSTKDLSAVGKQPTIPVGKPPPVPNMSTATTIKSSPRKKLSPVPPTPRKSATGPTKSSLPPAGSPQPTRKSPLPAAARSPRTPKRPMPTVKPAVPAKPSASTAKPNPTTATTRSSAASRPPPGKSSPRLPKKQPSTTVSKPNVAQTSSTPKNDGTQAATVDNSTTTVITEATTTTTTKMETTSIQQSMSSSEPTTTTVTTVAVTAPTSTMATPVTAIGVSPVTASTSATAIATTHATNAVASPVVSGGPIVTAAPPPAAIAANTLATLSVVDPSAMATGATATATTLKPPPSAMRSREQSTTVTNNTLSRPAATVIVVDGGGLPPETASVRQSVQVTATTPPLSYELQEIVVEPETENQSGRTAIRLPVDADGHKTLSTGSSSNGHKTVAWARQSEKIIVAADVQRPIKMAPVPPAKDPAYKRFARKLCGGDRRRPGGTNTGKRSKAAATPSGKRAKIATAVGKRTSATAAADSRSKKCWAAVWKRRPRLCARCCKRSDGVRPTEAAAAAAAAAASVAADTTASGNVRSRKWWPRWSCCCCAGKRKKKLAAAASSSSTSSHSVGALGIAPPTLPPSPNTFCGKLKQRLCCCCGCCAMPKFFQRLCCCRPCCSGPGRPAAPKKSDKKSMFNCTGCCTNIPKLDAVFVDHSSVMKGAIPVLPITLAWMCLVFNVIIPGAGTFSSGMLCLCVGKPRFTVNDNFQSRIGAFCVNFIVAAAQLFTVLFCLVGWGWSIWWGVIMLRMAKKYQKVKVVDQPNEAPIAIDHNHQI